MVKKGLTKKQKKWIKIGVVVSAVGGLLYWLSRKAKAEKLQEIAEIEINWVTDAGVARNIKIGDKFLVLEPYFEQTDVRAEYIGTFNVISGELPSELSANHNWLDYITYSDNTNVVNKFSLYSGNMVFICIRE